MPTDEDYLDALRELADDLGHTPTKAEMNADGPHSTTPYYTRWGSWNAALDAAGLDPNHREPTDDELLDELRRVADEHGEPVLESDMDEHGKFHPATYHRHFESWFDAREQAGLDPEDIRPGRRVDEAELIDALQAHAAELGRPPSKAEVNERDAGYSVSPYLTAWGSFEDALDAAGLTTET